MSGLPGHQNMAFRSAKIQTISGAEGAGVFFLASCYAEDALAFVRCGRLVAFFLRGGRVSPVLPNTSAAIKAEELQPDLIVLDIGLPTLHGIEAARRDDLGRKQPAPLVRSVLELVHP
jgi:CheY-like chemotaxis protein